MADVAHSEYEPSPFEQFEQLTGVLIKVTKAEAKDTLNHGKEVRRERAQKEPHK